LGGKSPEKEGNREQGTRERRGKKEKKEEQEGDTEGTIQNKKRKPSQSL
jgi:hypothetical protein